MKNQLHQQRFQSNIRSSEVFLKREIQRMVNVCISCRPYDCAIDLQHEAQPPKPIYNLLENEFLAQKDYIKKILQRSLFDIQSLQREHPYSLSRRKMVFYKCLLTIHYWKSCLQQRRNLTTTRATTLGKKIVLRNPRRLIVAHHLPPKFNGAADRQSESMASSCSDQCEDYIYILYVPMEIPGK